MMMIGYGGALDTFWDLANQFPNIARLYGGIQIVNEQHRVLAEINSNLNGNCFAPIMGPPYRHL